MSRFAHADTAGSVIVRPAKPGRRTHFGALTALEGSLWVCIGYTADGKNTAFVPMRQLHTLKGAYRKNRRRLLYRVLERVMQHYELKEGY